MIDLYECLEPWVDLYFYTFNNDEINFDDFNDFLYRKVEEENKELSEKELDKCYTIINKMFHNVECKYQILPFGLHKTTFLANTENQKKIEENLKKLGEF